MERPMTEWNDDRLDELNGRVKEGFTKVDERFIRLEDEMKDGFAKVDERFIRLEGEMKEGFAKVDERFAKVDERFAKVDERFEQVATRESVADLKAETSERLNRLDVRMDRLYWAFVVLVVMLAGNFIAHSV